ncbi:hypothetical protein KM043_006361 [Ampulex compressa]|nr:hypothetical protein KM043_006361 [Ampulex compressa]
MKRSYDISHTWKHHSCALRVIPPRKRAHFVPVLARTAAASRQPTTYPCGRRRHLHPARRTPRDWMAPPARELLRPRRSFTPVTTLVKACRSTIRVTKTAS